MMASADTKKMVMPASDSIDKRKAGYKRRQDAVLHKPQATVQMIHDALTARIQADYVLMDTWFINAPFIKELIAEGIGVIGMLKDIKQRYWYKGRPYNLKQLAMFADFNTQHNIFGSVCVKTGKHNISVKLFGLGNRCWILGMNSRGQL